MCFGDAAVCTVTSSNPSSPLAATLVTSIVAITLSPSLGLWYGPYGSPGHTINSYPIKFNIIIHYIN